MMTEDTLVFNTIFGRRASLLDQAPGIIEVLPNLGGYRTKQGCICMILDCVISSGSHFPETTMGMHICIYIYIYPGVQLLLGCRGKIIMSHV